MRRLTSGLIATGVLAAAAVLGPGAGPALAERVDPTSVSAAVKTLRDGRQRIYGLVTPLDQRGERFYLLTSAGQVEVRLGDGGTVGVLFRERNNKKMLEQRRITIARAGKSYPLPKRLYVKAWFKDYRSARRAVDSGEFTDGMLLAKATPDHLPTPSEPWLSGELTGLESGHITPKKVITVGGRRLVGKTSGHNYSEQVAGLLSPADIEPFVNEASVYGEFRRGVFVADHVLLRAIPDQVAEDDPALPRYLFIGDSISGNYGPSLREALAGRFNVHHPPTNCGPSGKGKNMTPAWLGDYRAPGRQWDVISFNFGHWDAGATKSVYQSNLERVIEQLEATGAELIWVTTCPVPNGFKPAGALEAGGRAPGRAAGVMKKYLNPWAMEVIRRRPAIAVCDQWRYCYDQREGLFREWWAGDDVHFRGRQAEALGRLLAETVLRVAGGDGSAAGSPRGGRPPRAEQQPARSPRKTRQRPAGAASTAEVRPATPPRVPMFRPGYRYRSKKKYGLYDEADAAAALPDAWRGVRRLRPGFPDEVSRALSPAVKIPDGGGGVIDLSRRPTAEMLAEIKREFKTGAALDWYFLPRERRYREGPGLTGDELLADLTSGAFPEDAVHVNFIYGFYTQNVTAYYRMYRVSGGDRYYAEQIEKYADGVEWLLANRPQQLLPDGRREKPLPDPREAIPHEPAAMANFWAHANAARLLLERAREVGLGPDHADVVKGRSLLRTLARYADSQISRPFKPFATRRGRPPDRLEPGERTRMLMDRFDLPGRAAQIIEYTPWNQTFFYFAVLAAAERALVDLQAIEGGRRYQRYIELYGSVVRAGMYNLQDENICVIRDGVPYFFHMHTPRRDGKRKTRNGFPVFGGEDVSHSTSGAWNLPYIWEAGEHLGVSPALLAGYAGAMVLTLENNCMTGKNGRPWPPSHIDSPWHLAATGPPTGRSAGTKGRYYPMMPFAPRIVAADRPYAPRARVAKDPNDLNRLYAGHLLRVWRQRRSAESGGR